MHFFKQMFELSGKQERRVRNFEVSISEIHCFIDILYEFGSVTVPRWKRLWGMVIDSVVANAMKQEV